MQLAWMDPRASAPSASSASKQRGEQCAPRSCLLYGYRHILLLRRDGAGASTVAQRVAEHLV